MDLITSSKNEKIKHIKKLYLKANRKKCGEFVIEGQRAVDDAIKNGAQIVTLVVSEEYEGEPCLPAYRATNKVFNEAAQTVSPQNILAVAKIPLYELKFEGLVIFCDDVRDPGNLGTIIRTADAVGAGAVILSKGCTDAYSPKVVRSTMSSIFNIPIFEKSDEVLDELKNNGYKIYTGALCDDATELFSCNLKGRAVLVVGNEGNGVRPEIIKKSDVVIKIPMKGKAESLNVSVSAAVLMYEHLRQNQ